MNKKTIISFGIIIVAVAALYFLLSAKTKPENTMIKPEDSISQNSCLEYGYPEGSYDLNTCEIKKEYVDEAIKLSEIEENEGDQKELAYIKNVYQKNGDIYIDADYFTWLSNDDGCVTPPKLANDTSGKPECNPNGFLIVNDNPTIRTFKLSPDVKIRPQIGGSGIPYLDAFTPEEFINGKNIYGQNFYEYDFPEQKYYVPFKLIFENKEIKFIHQIYVP
jgi:hypothetical protein